MSTPCDTVEAAAAAEIAKCIKLSGFKFCDSKLNPNAAEWKPTAEENRSLFITFPDRVAPSKTQIDYYFSRRYGEGCIERVYIKQRRHELPQWGKIVFKMSMLVMKILQGRVQQKLCIGGKSVRCKKFRARETTERSLE